MVAGAVEDMAAGITDELPVSQAGFSFLSHLNLNCFGPTGLIDQKGAAGKAETPAFRVWDLASSIWGSAVGAGKRGARLEGDVIPPHPCSRPRND
jgi:hypothetical protein